LGNLSTPKTVPETADGRCTRKRRQKPAIGFMPCTTRSAARTFLAHSYAQCRSNKGAPGVDVRTSRTLRRTGAAVAWRNWRLRSGRRDYQPDPIRRVFIPKANGKLQAIGALDRAGSGLHDVSDAGAEPIFEADLPPETVCLPSRAQCPTAVVEVEELLFRGHPAVVGRRPRGLLREHSACRTSKVGSAPDC